MIYGIGVDIIRIDRIQKMINCYGDHFINRIFTKVEKEKASNRSNRDRTYAKIFAAKEAFIKALGGSYALSWHDMMVSNNEAGKPYLNLSSHAEEKLFQIIGSKNFSIHLSISDEPPHAIAYLIIEMR
jgi:holo-[acyl-carrier protein] synthase